MNILQFRTELARLLEEQPPCRLTWSQGVGVALEKGESSLVLVDHLIFLVVRIVNARKKE